MPSDTRLLQARWAGLTTPPVVYPGGGLDASPLDCAARETESFAAARLPPPPARILEVGAGDGRVAARLRARGYDVLAIDSSPDAVERAAALGNDVELADFHALADGPFDAVLFTRSLHHLSPLDATLERARSLLPPGGVLIAEEFAWERADEAALTWLAARRRELVEEGAIDAAQCGRWPDDPRAALGSWVRHHRDEHGVHTGGALERAARAAFRVVEIEHAPYLYRELCRDTLSGKARAVERVLEAERRAISERELPALGLRMVARAAG